MNSELVIGLLFGIAIGYVAVRGIEKGYWWIYRISKKEPIFRIKGYRIHHSLLGILMFLICFVVVMNPILFGSGIGIILRHTEEERRLTFIDRR